MISGDGVVPANGIVAATARDGRLTDSDKLGVLNPGGFGWTSIYQGASFGGWALSSGFAVERVRFTPSQSSPVFCLTCARQLILSVSFVGLKRTSYKGIQVTL